MSSKFTDVETPSNLVVPETAGFELSVNRHGHHLGRGERLIKYQQSAVAHVCHQQVTLTVQRNAFDTFHFTNNRSLVFVSGQNLSVHSDQPQLLAHVTAVGDDQLTVGQLNSILRIINTGLQLNVPQQGSMGGKDLQLSFASTHILSDGHHRSLRARLDCVQPTISSPRCRLTAPLCVQCW